MIRSLNVLIATVIGLVALGAIAVAGATGAEFHCSVEPCRFTLKPDETAGTKTGHHVAIFKKEASSGSATCNQLTGEGTSNTKTTKELTITGLKYDECSLAGTPITVDFKGCTYLLTAGPPSTWTIKCPEGKVIEWTVISGGVTRCVITWTPQGPLSGLVFHDAGLTQTEVTLSILVKGIHGFAHVGCLPYLGFEGTFILGEYTTGNTIITGETTAGVHASEWYA
jgi:hypothetical protein